MNAKSLLIFAATSGALAVMLGAFAAHGLQTVLAAHSLQTFKTGVFYQFVHTLALVAVALLMLHVRQQRLLQWSGTLFAVGIVLFCSSLYALALGAPRALGIVTPLGGVAFICAWLSLLLAAVRMK